MESIQLFWGFHLIECEQEFVNAELQARLILSLSIYICATIGKLRETGKLFVVVVVDTKTEREVQKNTHEIRKSKGTHAFTMMKNEQEAHDFFSSAFQIAKWHVKKHLVAY